jgi:predicted DNA-binding transcriptional regulator AlpA
MANRILRFIDLKEWGVVNNRPTLYRWIKVCGFPQGFLLGPNSRAWKEEDVVAWLQARPTASGQIGHHDHHDDPNGDGLPTTTGASALNNDDDMPDNFPFLERRGAAVR